MLIFNEINYLYIFNASFLQWNINLFHKITDNISTNSEAVIL